MWKSVFATFRRRAGTHPVKSFPLRNSVFSLGRLPSAVGSTYRSLLFGSLILVTRPSPLVVTPYQVPIGLSLSQLAYADRLCYAVDEQRMLRFWPADGPGLSRWRGQEAAPIWGRLSGGGCW